MSYRKGYFLILFLLCLTGMAMAQNPSCSVASKFYSKDSINITTFGASTVQGVNGHYFQGFLQQNFEACYPGKIVTITNNGIAGQTTSQGLPRFGVAIAGRTGFVCILMGINDVLAITNAATPLTTAQVNRALAVTQSNMEKMLQMSLDANLVPIIGTVQFLTSKANVKSYTAVNAYVRRINTGYANLVKKYAGKAYLADINPAIGLDAKLYQADGIHPNDAGDKVIAYVWFDAINEAIESKLLLIGLDQNFPNPARTSTTIGFSLSQSGTVAVQLYSITGANIRTITNEFYNSGYHQIVVPLSDLKPGIYIYVMSVAGRQLTKKMIVVG